jgi:hypothetical protein
MISDGIVFGGILRVLGRREDRLLLGDGIFLCGGSAVVFTDSLDSE